MAGGGATRAGPLGLGLVGTGMVAELHARAIAASDRARLVAVHDADFELAQARGREWSCRAHAAYHDLLADDDVDAVFVLTPTRLHVEHAIAALDAGRPVLVEKPVGSSLDQLHDLAQAVERTGLVCMPGHNYAYIPEIARIRRLVTAGELGTIRLLAITFAIAHTEEVAAHYDGVVRLVLPHHAYLVHGMLGLPERVHAGVTEPGWARLERDDQCWATLDYPPHGTALLFASLGVSDDSLGPWTFTVKVLGTEGSAAASWNAGIVRRAIGSHDRAFVPYEESYEHELDAFCAAVDGDDGAIVSPLADAFAVDQIVGAVEEAARTGTAVALAGGRV